MREFLGIVDVEPSIVVGGKGWLGMFVQRWGEFWFGWLGIVWGEFWVILEIPGTGSPESDVFMILLFCWLGVKIQSGLAVV